MEDYHGLAITHVGIDFQEQDILKPLDDLRESLQLMATHGPKFR